MQPYKKLNDFLKEKFGQRVLKICIDGGFTCPNRDGKCGVGGCIFCGERGSGERTKRVEISSQVLQHLDSYRGKRADKFIVYFQNFSNTYADLDTLKQKYDSALVSDKIVALAVATRPDCIDEEVAKLLDTYRQKGLYVWVELGLQTVNKSVAKIINRGYTNEQFLQALNTLHKYNIDVVGHIMLGLPREAPDDVDKIIDFINKSGVDGLKIHSTYVARDTKLAKLYNEGIYSPIELDEYIDKVIKILTHINPEIVIHRITGDAPKDLLLAPAFTGHKKQVLNKVENFMKNEKLFQGIYYKK